MATVGLGRIAVEFACLEAMQLAQRSVGLTAFRRGTPMERLCRDLGASISASRRQHGADGGGCLVARQPPQPIIVVLAA